MKSVKPSHAVSTGAVRYGRMPGGGRMRGCRLKGWLCILLAGILFLGGCSGTAVSDQGAGYTAVEDEEEKIRIGLSFDSFVIERWLRDRDVFVSAAQQLGAEVNVQNANGVVEEQIAQIEYLIDKGMDVIVIVAIDGEALTEVVEKAHRAGIKIISYDRLIRGAGTDLYISFDNEMVGTLMGEALAAALPEGGKVLEIQGSESDNNVLMLHRGFEKALEGTGVEVVYSTYCRNWLAELAFDAVSAGIETAGGKIDGVMCGNDDLAGQAIKALTEHKLAGEIPVVAQDAELSACQRIVEGTQTMTVFKPVEQEARMAAEYAVAMAEGRPVTGEGADPGAPAVIYDGVQDVPYVPLEPIAVTVDNIDDEIIKSGFHQREDVYLNVS